MKIFKLLFMAFIVITSQVSFAKTNTLKAQSASDFKMPATAAVTGNSLTTILWGADITALQAGYNTHLQNNIITQIEDVISGKTPYFRGTVGQAVFASDKICEKDENCLVWVYKYSDSTGGDGIGAINGIKQFSDLCGKKAGLQFGGPSKDFAADVDKLAKCSKGNDIQYIYYKDLGLDSKTHESAVDALIAGEIDAAFGITVDLKSDELKKKSDYNIIVTTATLRNSISDHIWVRKDYTNAHPDEIAKLAHDLLIANEKTKAIAEQNSTEWQNLKEKGAELLFEAPNDPNFISAIGDMYLYDLTMAGWTGNYKFATCDAGNGKQEVNCLKSQIAETSEALQKMGLLKNINNPSKITAFNHNWEALKKGLNEKFGAEVKLYSDANVAQAVSKLASTGSLDNGFVSITINFDANDNDFNADLYTAQFDDTFKIMAKSGGSISTITAHADPSKYLLEKYGVEVLPANFPKALRDKLQAQYGNGVEPQVWKNTLQAAQDSSQRRANEMFQALQENVNKKGYNISFSNVVPQGMGVKSPVNGTCKYSYQGTETVEPCFPSSSEIAKQNRRAVFSAHNMDGEIDLTKDASW
ncbi:MAG: hypothetical protein PHS49_05060 [Candidatus Gracilibacteria bacterium]|nr:hypothetical protein [Candidatus Gracilibacteria bacterium]